MTRREWKPIRLSRGGPQLFHMCFADDLILFAEASVSQIKVIRRVLERFCSALGQKVSIEKSKIFFSENVSRDLEKLIIAESGIQATRDLGRYLGMPVLQRRINKDTFGYILERMSSRLTGWKGKCLNLAGRITLTRGVLSTIPVHTMSIISLPKSTLEKIDQISRSFIWGSTQEQRKQHLLAWSKVCKPKNEGGLGIRSATAMNKALLAKVGWRLLHDNVSLWTRVVCSKYKVKDAHDTSWLITKGTWSSTWRSIGLGLREVVIPGIRWVIGDGKSVSFWKDKWLFPKTLCELSSITLPDGITERRVCDYWQNGTGWAIEQIEQLVPEMVTLSLRALVIGNVTGSRDRLSWGGSSDGKFSVCSAYSLLQKDDTPRHDLSALFSRIWRVTAPERVRSFLWLGAHQVLMTNVERHRRHLTNSGMCQVCRGGDETIIHILRDCPAMAGVWLRLVPRRRHQEFFAASLLEWLYSSLGDSSKFENTTWATLFAITVWWGWKWRCINVFKVDGKCRDRVRFVKDQANEVTLALSKRAPCVQLQRTRVEKEIKWICPDPGWIKINTDGASKGNSGLAYAGGVIRDANGAWCQGFALNIGMCTAPLAELWGVYYGLVIAWERRSQRVELEVDSEVVVGFLKSGISEVNPLSFLVCLCHGLISRDWIVRISHVYREANRLADGLANYASSLSLGFHLFDFVSDIVNPILLEDIVGVSFPRRVPL
ncbi:unnamed protein product [Microthlaspi erraticum]|uniref:RNase H type-1 domain-containing protein n=1 Tax=Microthlaspi erraticum TaxID=1685480 RepID=A0A6D2IA52_9BRAS|nr:unnamed protein product [Microthlaspi erraticum]